MATGYVKLFRSFLDWEWYHDIPTCRLFLHILLNATHTPLRYAGIELKPGDYISSIRQLAAQTGLSERQVRTIIKRLKATQEVTQEKRGIFTVYTVKNYLKFQEATQEVTQQRHSSDTAATQQRHNNKNEKNEKNEKNIYSAVPPSLGTGDSETKKPKAKKTFTKPTVDEVAAYCTERNNGINPQSFIDYYESVGWLVGKNPMKDWKACVRTWESRRKKSSSVDTSTWTDEQRGWLT